MKEVWLKHEGLTYEQITILFDAFKEWGCVLHDHYTGVGYWIDGLDEYFLIGCNSRSGFDMSMDNEKITTPLEEVLLFLGIDTVTFYGGVPTKPTFTWEDYDNQIAPPVGSNVTCGKGGWDLYKNIVEVITPPLESENTVCIVKYEGKYYHIEHHYLTPTTPRKSVREQKEDYLLNKLGELSQSKTLIQELLDGLDNIK